MTASVSNRGGQVSPASANVALGDSFELTILPDESYAVDTIRVNEVAYVNDGRTVLPEGCTWDYFVVPDIQSNTTITVSFAATSGSTSVPDKYKLIVNAISNGNGSVSPSRQLVVYGSDAIINITPDVGFAVDTITDGTNTYVNNGQN